MKVIRQGEGGADDPFDALAGEAAALEGATDQAGGPGGAEATGPAMPTNAEVIAQALALVRDTGCAFAKVKSLQRTINDENCRIMGDLWGPVCDKHGLRLADMAGDYLPELRAIMTTIGIFTVAWSELRDEIRAMKATPVQPEPDRAAPAETATEAAAQ